MSTIESKFKKAVDAKDIKTLERLNKIKNISEKIPIDVVVRCMKRAIKNDDLKLCFVIAYGIFLNYDIIERMRKLIDINDKRLVEDFMLTTHPEPCDCDVILDYALNQGKLGMAEIIYPFSVYNYDKDVHGIKSYVKFKNFIDNHWFTVDENDMTADGFILAVAANRNDLVKKILKVTDINLAARDAFAITYACDYGYVDVVRTLLKYDKKCFYVDDKYAYDLAVQRRYVDIVKMMDEVIAADLN